MSSKDDRNKRLMQTNPKKSMSFNALQKRNYHKVKRRLQKEGITKKLTITIYYNKYRKERIQKSINMHRQISRVHKKRIKYEMEII